MRDVSRQCQWSVEKGLEHGKKRLGNSRTGARPDGNLRTFFFSECHPEFEAT